jgi:formylmethanofuran dehydrogenase subunit A
MVLKLKGGRLYDPAHGVNGEVRDIHVRDGRVI